MNARERFIAVMNFERVDRSLLWEVGYWGNTMRRWYAEGLPRRLACRLPDDLIFRSLAEIRQDSAIRNRGAVLTSKLSPALISLSNQA